MAGCINPGRFGTEKLPDGFDPDMENIEYTIQLWRNSPHSHMQTGCPICGIRIIRGTIVCPNPRCQSTIKYEHDPAFDLPAPWPKSPWASTRDKDVGDYPCLVELPPWNNARGLLAAASSLKHWIQLDEFWIAKGEPRMIHREIVAAYRAYVDVREQALFHVGYHNANEESADDLIDRLIPLGLKRASEKSGVEREGQWPHKMAELPQFAQHPNLP